MISKIKIVYPTQLRSKTPAERVNQKDAVFPHNTLYAWTVKRTLANTKSQFVIEREFGVLLNQNVKRFGILGD